MHQVRRWEIPLSDGTWKKTVVILLIVGLDLDVAPIKDLVRLFEVLTYCIQGE